MKKIGIVNHWMVNNYGALLLAYALEKGVAKLGYEVENIVYLNDETKRPWKVSISKKIGLKMYLLRLGYFIVYILPREKTFKRVRKMMKKSKCIYNDKTFRRIENQYDKILIGGDQLWNTKINYYNRNYYLPFIKDKKKKIVYAASIAQEDIRKEIRCEFKKNVEEFSYITTREEKTSELIKKYTCALPYRVADPAFLLKKEEWERLEIKPKKQNRYIFVYQVQSDLELITFAEKLAKEKGMKIVYCPFPLKKQIKCSRKPYISPERWLGYLHYADYVITDAFHGVVFSIIFNKQFYAEISQYGSDTSSRILNILDLYQIRERLLNENGFEILDRKINFERINKIIKRERADAYAHLKAMLEC